VTVVTSVYNNVMTLSDILLAYLKSNKSNYKEMRKYLHGYSKTHQEKEPSNQTISTTLYRLKKRGLLTKDSETFQTTYQGNKYLDTNNKSLKFFHRDQKKNSSRKIICMFDIPEDIRHKRNWLRNQLEILDFALLQNSVWIGPAPLPRDFVAYLTKLELTQHIKFLEVTNKDII